MPRYNPLFTETFDQILAQLVQNIGERRWADIARQMKQIYDYDIPIQTMICSRWRAIDPKINREPFNPDEMAQHWRFCVKYCCNWEAVRMVYESIGQQRDKSYLMSKFFQLFWFKITELNKNVAPLPDFNQLRIDNMRDVTKKRILELNGKDLKTITNKPAQKLIKGCQIIVKLMSFSVDNYRLDNNQLREEVMRIISLERLQEAFFQVFMVDTMMLISLNELRATDDFSDLFEVNDEIKKKYKKPTKVKSWNEALQEESSSEHTEEEEILQQEIKVNKYEPKCYFNKDDIEQIKNSEVYKYCSTDQNHKFYSWYNEAKMEDPDLIVSIKEINENKEKQKQLELCKPESKWQIKKKTPNVAKRQMKEIEKKKKVIMRQEEEKDKIKTVRGKIKLDKKLFHNQYTRFFDKEESNDENDDCKYSLVDAEQMYKLMMKNHKN